MPEMLASCVRRAWSVAPEEVMVMLDAATDNEHDSARRGVNRPAPKPPRSAAEPTHHATPPQPTSSPTSSRPPIRLLSDILPPHPSLFFLDIAPSHHTHFHLPVRTTFLRHEIGQVGTPQQGSACERQVWRLISTRCTKPSLSTSAMAPSVLPVASEGEHGRTSVPHGAGA